MACSGVPEIKVTYFHFAGRAESIRLALYINGVTFTDDRFTREEWPKIKPTTPFGQVPTMTIDGKQYAQTGSLLRYAGRITGMHPSDPIKALPIEMICDAFDDVFAALRPLLSESDRQKKKELTEEFLSEALPRIMSAIDKLVGQDDPKFCCGNSLSIADLIAFNMLVWLKSGKIDHVPKDCTDQFRNLARVFETVRSHPKVIEWRSKHQTL
uniref:GST N-terminal domain-containing protein n=1 Tax=Spongospora subterranea TaxID=70186 RepID=A0A0H5R519_9EUKA|eukprot:CRZ08981.1 hypothetical protein [Spongospora subterranea]